MKTTILSLLFLFALPFFAQAQDEKQLEGELKDVKLKIEQIFKDLEDQRVFQKVDSVFQARWPELEAEMEDAWEQAEPKIEEVEQQVEKIAEEILKEMRVERKRKPREL
jgi:chaperonin cofactor prefoldin